MYEDILTTVLIWSVYYTLHSLLVIERVKNVLKSAWPWVFQNYRIFYNIISTIGLMAIFYYLATTKSMVLLNADPWLKYLGLVIASWGIIVIKVSFKNYSLKDFIGLESSNSQYPLIQEGLLKHVRHPIYSGTILVMIGFWFYIPNLLNLLSVLCTLAYLFVGIRLEEAKLILQYGDDYLEYKKSTPMLFPQLFR